MDFQNLICLPRWQKQGLDPDSYLDRMFTKELSEWVNAWKYSTWWNGIVLIGVLFQDNLIPSANDQGEKSSENVSSMFAKVAEGASSQTTKEPDGKSLDEAAKEYEESRKAEKRKYDEVETFTGEEEETNIIDVSSFRFLFGEESCS